MLAVDAKGLTDEGPRVAAVAGWLRSNRDWLLIIDGVDTEESAKEFERFLGLISAGTVIITSRISSWGAGVEVLPLAAIDTDSAARLLLERTEPASPTSPGRIRSETDDLDAGALATALEGHPLVLQLASGYIRTKRIRFTDYLTAWKSHDSAVLEWNAPRITGSPSNLVVTLRTTFDELSHCASALLRILAAYAPDPFPIETLNCTESAQVVADGVALIQGHAVPELSPASVTEAIEELADFNLVNWNAECRTLAIHPVTAEAVYAWIPEAQRERWVLLSIGLLTLHIPNEDPVNPSTWPTWRVLIPHVISVLGRSRSVHLMKAQSRLLGYSVSFLITQGASHEAEPLARWNMEAIMAEQGRESTDTANCMNSLACALIDLDKFAEARELYEEALEIAERNLGPTHRTTCIALNNLAFALGRLGNWTETTLMLERSVSAMRASSECDDGEIANVLNSLASAYMELGRIQDALKRHQEAVDIAERVHGAGDHRTAIFRNNLGTALQVQGDLEGAAREIRQSLTVVESSLGREHPCTTTALNNLANVLRETGAYEESEPLYLEVSQINKARFGPDHSTVALDLNNYGRLLTATGRGHVAVDLHRRALEINESIFPEDHLHIAQTLVGLADALRSAGAKEEAEAYLRRAVGIHLGFKSKLEYENPQMQPTIDAYVALRREMGRGDAEIEAAINEMCIDLGLSVEPILDLCTPSNTEQETA